MPRLNISQMAGYFKLFYFSNSPKQVEQLVNQTGGGGGDLTNCEFLSLQTNCSDETDQRIQHKKTLVYFR